MLRYKSLISDINYSIAIYVGGEVEGIVVEQNRTENGSFSFEIVRKRAFSDGDVWHQYVAAGGEVGVYRKNLELRTLNLELKTKTLGGGRSVRTPSSIEFSEFRVLVLSSRF